jgi:hypothetical protein
MADARRADGGTPAGPLIIGSRECRNAWQGNILVSGIRSWGGFGLSFVAQTR